MSVDLQSVLEILRAHESDLRRLGVAHAVVFGSVARGEVRAGGDIEVLIDLDEKRPVGIFEYARLKLYVNGLFNIPIEVVNRRTLRPLLEAGILHDTVHAF
uniref:DNA polymerase, beta domain protein region n=1 Tax=Solibacter usitatus (strain Ellin6076) TaxID=234267 RepID=Q01YL8_SOLUE